MLQRFTIFFLVVCIALTYSYADVDFSIRYHDKNIYYPGDRIEVKLTLANKSSPGSSEETFFLADDPRQSFGFNLQDLSGRTLSPAKGYASALHTPSAYRIVHLAPGQELSLVVALNDWIDITQADQYRLTGFFYSRLRGPDTAVAQANTVLDLSVLPRTDEQWIDQLDENIRKALVSRDLDPWSVVRETVENRSDEKYNRAIIYLDLESLTRNSPLITVAENLKNKLLKGSWQLIPGMDLPIIKTERLSTQVYQEEAIVHLVATYAGLGERFERNLRFYLHNRNGYWAIRHIETFPKATQVAAPRQSGIPAMEPPDVVAELIRAAIRGDWDIVFRHYSIEHLVSNLPEYKARWKNMDSTNHQLALANYRAKIISGDVEMDSLPLTDMEDWEIVSVNYTQLSGYVVVVNNKDYDTLEGKIRQKTRYTFRIERSNGTDREWVVKHYNAVRINE